LRKNEIKNNIMVSVHPQYITDSAGEKLVVLPISEFNSIMEELEDMEDVRLYDDAKKSDTGERIPMEDAFKMIEAKRKNKE
jgi:PHD/YefM family antitoxin component YafN of YafNO toxin-antitoxin module